MRDTRLKAKEFVILYGIPFAPVDWMILSLFSVTSGVIVREMMIRTVLRIF